MHVHLFGKANKNMIIQINIRLRWEGEKKEGKDFERKT